MFLHYINIVETTWQPKALSHYLSFIHFPPGRQSGPVVVVFWFRFVDASDLHYSLVFTTGFSSSCRDCRGQRCFCFLLNKCLSQLWYLMCVFFSCFGTNTCPDKDMQPVYSVEWRLFVSLHCLLMFVIYSIVQKALWMLYSYPSCSVMKIYPAMSTGAMFRLKNTGLLVIQMVCQTPRWPQSQCFKKMNLPARVPRAIFGFWAIFFFLLLIVWR